MATVSTYFKMMDQFSRPLQSVSNGVQTALAAMERLKRVVEAPVSMSVNTTKAIETINRTKAQLASNSGESAIQVAINGKAITQELNGIRQRLQSGLSSAALQVGLDTRPALQEVGQVRDRIASALGKVEIAVQLDMPAQLPMTQPQAVNVPIQLDQANATTQWQSFRNRVLVDGLPALTLEVNAEKAVTAVERARDKITSSKSAPLELALNVQDIVGKVADLKRRIKTELSESIVHVTLDKQQAVNDAANLRSQINGTLGQFELEPKLELPQTKEIHSRIATMLQEASPTVTARLAFDPNSAYEQIFKATKQLQSMPIGLKTTLDTSETFAEAEQIKNQIAQSKPIQLSVMFTTENAAAAIERLRERISANGSTVVELALNVRDIISKVAELKNKILSELSDAIVKVTIDRQQSLVDAAALRSKIQTTLGQVQLKPTMELPQIDDLRSKISNHLKGIVANVAVKFTLDSVTAHGQINKVLDKLGARGVSLTATLDASGAMAKVDRIKQTIKSASSSAINVILDSNSVTKLFQEVQHRLGSGFVLQVTLDKQIALAEAGTLRNQVNNTLGQVALTVTLDASRAMAEVERLKQRISSGAFSAIHVILDAQSVTIVFQQIQQRIKSETERYMLKVTFNASEAVRKTKLLKGLLERQLDGIRAKIQVDLPASLTVMFTNLQRLVMRFIAATRRLHGVAGNQSSAQQQIVKQQQRILQLQNQINASTQRTSQASDDWLSNLKGIAATYLSFQGMKALFGSTVGGAMEQQKMLDMFIARAGDVEIGTGMFKKFKADALAAGQDVNKSLQSTLSFFSSTQNVDHLTKLNNLTSRLSAFDSAGNGIEGAAFALKEAMSGDIVSLAERFNMSKADIRAFKIDGLGKSGDIDGFIKAFDLLLEKQRMGQEAFDRMMASPAKQAEVFGSNIKSAMADAGMTATTALMPLITMLNTAFQEGKFQPFFDGLSTGLKLVADVAAWAGELILNNLDIVRNILIAIGIVAIAVGIKFLAAWVMAAWPIFLIIGIITGLIALLNYFGVSTSEIIGYIAGSFMALVAFIWNRIAFLWNIILSFAEFLVNIFIDPIYAIKKLFYDLAMAFGGQVYNMLRSAESFAGGFMKLIIQAINGVLKGFNWLSDKVKDLFGINMGQATLFDEDNVHAMSDAVQDLLNKIEKPTSNKNVVDFSGAKMKPLDQGEMFNKGFSFGSGAFDSVSNAFDKVTDFTDWNKQENLSKGAGELDKVGKVGQLDKIKDTVDISSEDLKMMRELAEMKNIQNFVTLQPSISFGDTHVKRESDINTIVARITDKLNEDIATSVDAVYT